MGIGKISCQCDWHPAPVHISFAETELYTCQ